MGDEWKIKSSGPTGSDIVTQALFGTSVKTYDVENVKTGETRQVYASDEKKAGEKIANGDFLDKKRK